MDVGLYIQKGGRHMGNIRKKYDATLKAKIALEAVKGEKTIAEISSEYGVHSTQIAHWKKQLLEELPSIFSDNVPKAKKEGEELEAKAYPTDRTVEGGARMAQKKIYNVQPVKSAKW
jgi:transposase